MPAFQSKSTARRGSSVSVGRKKMKLRSSLIRFLFVALALSTTQAVADGVSGMPQEVFDRVQKETFCLFLAQNLQAAHTKLLQGKDVIVIDPRISCRYEMVIGKEGELVSCALLRSSGSTSFDSVAEKALRSVFPRRNVPSGMLKEEHGKITVSFEFRMIYESEKAGEPAKIQKSKPEANQPPLPTPVERPPSNHSQVPGAAGL